MKFAEHLAAHITPEWRKQYIQYEVRPRAALRAPASAPRASRCPPCRGAVLMERRRVCASAAAGRLRLRRRAPLGCPAR